jgi:LmbE family N-acetylglucosaminyl deacetylase
MNKSIAIIAAHPDDEVLGMGGTIARHKSEGDQVYVLFLGDGVGSRGKMAPQTPKERKQDAQNACNLLGADILGFEDFPDNSFDTVPLLQIVRSVENAKKEVNPDIIYTHHGGDLNVDHRITCQATLTAFRPLPNETFREIRSFEVNSSTEWGGMAGFFQFKPNIYIDITPYLEILTDAFDCYAKEVRPEPHILSLESLKYSAIRRGREVGVYAAEAFMTLLRIIRL